MTFDFSNIRAVVSDMDGVIWRGDQLLDGTKPFFAFLQEKGFPFVLATNNSRRSPEEYVEKLTGYGLENIQTSQIMTSSIATADYMKAHYPAGIRVYVVGEAGIREALTKAGFAVVEHDVQVVVAGLDFTLNYTKLKNAVYFIQRGADFIGTNPDVTYPTPEGFAPGAGSVLASIQVSTGVEPTIIGKPRKAMFEASLRVMNVKPEETLMIGDRIETDIVGAKKLGMPTALVLSGVAQADSLDQIPDHAMADRVFDDLTDMLNQWRDEL